MKVSYPPCQKSGLRGGGIEPDFEHRLGQLLQAIDGRLAVVNQVAVCQRMLQIKPELDTVGGGAPPPFFGQRFATGGDAHHREAATRRQVDMTFNDNHFKKENTAGPSVEQP